MNRLIRVDAFRQVIWPRLSSRTLAPAGEGVVANWPPCPYHPDSHPMKVSTRAAVAVWTCPADETSIAPIGAL